MANISQTFIPSPGFVLIKVQDEEQQDILIVQNSEKTPASRGVVVAVGEPKLHESGKYCESRTKIGDLIIFKPYGIIELMLNNESHRIIDFDNIRGVLK